jgi:hypothetical protein
MLRRIIARFDAAYLNDATPTAQSMGVVPFKLRARRHPRMGSRHNIGHFSARYSIAMLSYPAPERPPSRSQRINVLVRAGGPAHAIRRFSPPGRFILLRTVLRFPARANTFSCGSSSSICAATVNPAHRICERQIQEHKINGWQDRLPPVLGVLCNALPLDKHGRRLSNPRLLTSALAPTAILLRIPVM